MFEIRSGLARPAPKGSVSPNLKYPLDRMGVDDYIIIPKAMMQPGDTAAKFRGRINQAVRTFKQRQNANAALKPGYKEEEYTPIDFTVLTLGDPPEDNPEAWEPGDVGVWRDA